MKFKNIYILVPAFNESKVIRKTLEELLLEFCNVVVVNDGSTDNSRSIINENEWVEIIKTIDV